MSPATPAGHQEIPLGLGDADAGALEDLPRPERLDPARPATPGQDPEPSPRQALQLIQKQASTGEASFPSAMSTGGAG
jgi:hypothetical protein